MAVVQWTAWPQYGVRLAIRQSCIACDVVSKVSGVLVLGTAQGGTTSVNSVAEVRRRIVKDEIDYHGHLKR